MKPLKLAIVRERHDPQGAAERFIAGMLPGLEQAGAEVTLVSRSAEGWGARRVLEVDPFYLGRAWREASFARAARKAWRRSGFDLVQSHERIAGCDVYRAGEGVRRRKLELLGGSTLLSLYHRRACAAEKAMFEHPRLRAVLCVSRMVREEVRRGFRIAPEKLHVVYDGVDLERFHPRARERLRGAGRAEIGCRPRDTVFLFPESDLARHGLDAALAALRGGAAHWRLVAAGRGARESERVRFVGSREDLRALYAAADCLLLPSRYDPFSAAVLEALAMGLPAIVSRASGAAEAIEPGVNGWVCEPDDAADLGRAMQAADAALGAATPGLAARASAERFGIEKLARQLGALYDSLRGG